jgi:ferredoxin
LFLLQIKKYRYFCALIVIIKQKIIEMAYKINDDCTACGTCIDECPVEAISEGDIYKIDPDVCTDCGACADVCPVEAIHPE